MPGMPEWSTPRGLDGFGNSQVERARAAGHDLRFKVKRSPTAYANYTLIVEFLRGDDEFPERNIVMRTNDRDQLDALCTELNAREDSRLG